MKKTICILFLSFLVISLCSNHRQLGIESQAVTIQFGYVFDDDNIEDAIPLTGTFGSVISLPSVHHEGYQFAFWIINGVVNTNPDLAQVVVTTQLRIQAIFKPEGKLAVVFIDSNGQFISVRFITSGESVSPPSIIEFSKPNMVVNQLRPWIDLITSSHTLSNILEDRVYQLQYVVDEMLYFNISVDGGTIETEPAITDPTPQYRYNQLVTVSAPLTQSGTPFSHWIDKNTQFRLSYDPEYTFTVADHRELQPVYTNDIDPMPLVNLTDDLNVRPNHDTYVGQFYVPFDYELIEYGFLVSQEEKIIMKDDINVITAQHFIYSEITHEFVMSFPEETYQTIRSYVVVKHKTDDTLLTVHSQKIISKGINDTYVVIDEYPTITHQGNISIAYGEAFDPFDSVLVTDHTDDSVKLDYRVIHGYSEYPSPVDFSSLSSGSYTIIYFAKNSLSYQSEESITLTKAAPTVYNLIIYEVYGGGGEENALYNRDYIVIYNPTSEMISYYTGISIQVASGTEAFNPSNIMYLYGFMAAYSYHLIGLHEGGIVTDKPFPTYPFTSYNSNININAYSGKIALVASGGLHYLSGSNDPLVIDFIGYGTTDDFRGEPQNALNNTLSARRKTFVNTNNNKFDFENVTPDLSYLTT